MPGCIVYLHGGGWVYGNLASHARLARMLAITTGTRVLYVDYRLAPENPYPAALDDAVAAWRWCVAESARNARLQGPLAIAGDSAGANLALAAMLREIEVERRIPDVALLFYGVYSADLDSPSYQRFAEGYGLNRAAMATLWDMYAPGERGAFEACATTRSSARSRRARRRWRACRRFISAPPVSIRCSAIRLAFAERLDAAGATYELTVHEGVQHAFMQHTARLDEARRAFVSPAPSSPRRPARADEYPTPLDDG